MKLSDNSIQYTVNQLFTISFPYHSFTLTRRETTVQILLEDELSISIPLLSEKENADLLTGKLAALPISTFDDKYKIPTFIPAHKEENNADIEIPFDIITPAFILLSRYEERISEVRDQFGRYPFTESILHHYHCIDLPLVDEYAMILRQATLAFNPSISIEKRKSTVIPTHDIDHLCRFPDFFTALKSILGGDLIKRHSLKSAKESLKQYRASRKDKLQDPMIVAIRKLIDCAEQSGLCAEFYFKGLMADEADATYDITGAPAKACTEEIRAHGMKVGMHGGFYSYNDKEIFRRERERLEKVTNSEIRCGRQHYLRFDIRKTIRVWETCNVENDSTLGFAEREGFRCGTSHPYPLYNIDNDCVTKIIEHPLIVMDGTLYQYRKLSKTESLAQIMQLYERCLTVEGDFVILWHNSTVFREFEPWFKEVYLKFLKQIQK